MKLISHMEAAFVVALGLAASTALIDTAPASADMQPTALRAAAIAQPVAQPVAIITITGKRMTPAEKRQSLDDERALASLHNAPPRRS